MTKYLISFPSSAMSHLSDAELERAATESHEVVREARAAGVWVFGGAIDEDQPPVLALADGSVRPGTYPESERIDGGFAILDLPDYSEALAWAGRIAAACRCAQEVRVFHDDPES